MKQKREAVKDASLDSEVNDEMDKTSNEMNLTRMG